MIVVKPVLGEFVAGHQGRLARVNGAETIEVFAARLRKTQQMQLHGERSPLATELVAELCKLSTGEYLRLTSFRHLYDYGRSIHEHRGKEVNLIKYLGALSERKEAFACRKCLHERNQSGKIQFWYRVHQLPGLQWCPIHRCALSCGPKSSFRECPSKILCLDESKPPTIDEDAFESAAVNRFYEIWMGMLDRLPRTERSAKDGGSLKSRLFLELQRREILPDMLISDLVLETMPPRWLQAMFPNIGQKKVGEAHRPIDGLGNAGERSPIQAIVALLSVLFSNASDALNVAEVMFKKIK